MRRGGPKRIKKRDTVCVTDAGRRERETERLESDGEHGQKTHISGSGGSALFLLLHGCLVITRRRGADLLFYPPRPP